MVCRYCEMLCTKHWDKQSGDGWDGFRYLYICCLGLPYGIRALGE